MAVRQHFLQGQRIRYWIQYQNIIQVIFLNLTNNIWGWKLVQQELIVCIYMTSEELQQQINA